MKKMRPLHFNSQLLSCPHNQISLSLDLKVLVKGRDTLPRELLLLLIAHLQLLISILLLLISTTKNTTTTTTIVTLRRERLYPQVVRKKQKQADEAEQDKRDMLELEKFEKLGIISQKFWESDKVLQVV